MAADVEIRRILDGRMCLISLLSEAANTWIDENADIHPRGWFGLDSFGDDGSQFDAWVAIFRGEGLEVEVLE